MRTILTIVLVLFFAQAVTAQNDSLVIKLDDYGQILIVKSNLVTKKNDTPGLDEKYGEFYEKFKKITAKRTFEGEGYFIEFTNGPDCPGCSRNLAIKITEKNKAPDKYYFYKDQIGSLLDYKFKLALSPQSFLFLDSLKDFENVANISLDSLYKQSVQQILPDTLGKRLPYLFFFNSNKGKISKESSFIYSMGRAQDYLNIYTSFGAQMINSNFAPQIDINMDLAFHKKNTLPAQKFGFSTTFLFMPDKDDFRNINTYNFVNVSYYLKFHKKWSQKISIGYLYSKNGDHFSDDTWNAFWQSKINDIGVKLGGYYTKNAEGDYVTIPSFGVSIGF